MILIKQKDKKVINDEDHQTRMQWLIKRTLSKDCFEKTGLVMEPKWLTLTQLKDWTDLGYYYIIWVRHYHH